MICPLQAILSSTDKGRTKIPKCLQKKKQAGDTFKISEDGRKSVRSLSGLQLGNDVMFLKQEMFVNPRQRIHVCNMFPQNLQEERDDSDDDDDGLAVVSHAMSDPGLYSDPGQDSLFSRPGLGTLVFRRNYSNNEVLGFDLYSVEGEGAETLWREQEIHFSERVRRPTPSLDQDISSSSTSLQKRNVKVPKHTNLQQRESPTT